MAKSKSNKAKGSRKHGRTERKARRRGFPLSLFVRDKITGEVYFRLTRQKK